MDDRREFLRKMARGIAYSAPVITTLAVPKELRAINVSDFNMGMGMGNLQSSPEGIGPSSPWAEPPAAAPPWSGNSPGTRGGGDEE